jgi:hypothetical protein
MDSRLRGNDPVKCENEAVVEAAVNDNQATTKWI